MLIRTYFGNISNIVKIFKMMNLASPHHPYTALGVGLATSGALGLQTSSMHGSPMGIGLPQRNSFAIQELLGLNNSSPERPRESSQSDSILSASAFIKSSLSAPLVSSVGAGFKDAAAIPYMAWKSSFMSALSNSAQNMLHFGAAHNPLLSKPDLKTGENRTPIITGFHYENTRI